MEQKKRIRLLSTLIGLSLALRHKLLADLSASDPDARAIGIASNTLMAPLKFIQDGTPDGIDNAFWSITNTRAQDYAINKNLLIAFLPELLAELRIQQVVKIPVSFGGAVFFFGRDQEPLRFCLVTSKLFSKSIANAIKRSTAFTIHELEQAKAQFPHSVVAIDDLLPFTSIVVEKGLAIDIDSISTAIEARLRRVNPTRRPVISARKKIQKAQQPDTTVVVRSKSSGTAEIISLLEQSDNLCHRLEARLASWRKGKVPPSVITAGDELLQARNAINEAITHHNKLIADFLGD